MSTPPPIITTMPLKYATAPVQIDALQYLDTPQSLIDMISWVGASGEISVTVTAGQRTMLVNTPDGKAMVSAGSWVTKDASGAFRVIDNATFAAQYAQA